VPAPQYFHSQFRYRSSKQRLRRCLWLALAGLGVIGIGAAIMAPPSASKSDVAIAPRDPVFRAETIPTASPVGSDGSCVTFQLPKVRMVRVATPRASSAGHQGNSAKPHAAAAATLATVGTMESKKAQRSAHRQNQRRNQPSHSTPSRGDVRVADWTARGYAHGDYGRQGFSRNFW
jgi:hypothetical protein